MIGVFGLLFFVGIIVMLLLVRVVVNVDFVEVLWVDG